MRLLKFILILFLLYPIKAEKIPSLPTNSIPSKRLKSLAKPLVFPTVTLAWDKSPDTVDGYNLCYGFKSGEYKVTNILGNVSNSVVILARSNLTYYFAVQAYLTNGIVSDFSNEVAYTNRWPKPFTFKYFNSNTSEGAITSFSIDEYKNIVMKFNTVSGGFYNILSTTNLDSWELIESKTASTNSCFYTNKAGLGRVGSFKIEIYSPE